MLSNKEELKKLLIDLLRTDEEFRLMAAGLLGFREILEELREIRRKSLEHDKRFEVLEKKLLEHDKRFEVLERKLLEHDKRFEAIERKLLEHDKRFEAIERKLLEHDKRFEVIEKKLMEHDRRLEAIERKLLEHDKRFEAIERKLLEHDKRLEAIERKLLEHDKRFEAIERKLLEHDKRLEAIEKTLVEHSRVLAEHSKALNELLRRVSRIEMEVGALAESFYTKALWDDLREELSQRGERIISRKRNARIDESDIDLLVETDKAIYVIEVKIKPRHEDVGSLAAKRHVVSSRHPGRHVRAILAGAMIGREVEDYARQLGIEVYTY